MGKWKTDLFIRVLGDRDYVLTSPLRYQDDTGETHEAPTGQRTDLGSVWNVPIISLRMAGRAQKACALHDYHYRTGVIPRKRADELLRESSLAELMQQGQSAEDAQELADGFYYGVRVFGWSSYQGPKEWNN